MEQSTASLTNLQLELLKVFSYPLSDKEILEIKQLLVKYFAERIKKNASKIWQKKEYTQKYMDKWLNDGNQ